LIGLNGRIAYITHACAADRHIAEMKKSIAKLKSDAWVDGA